MAIRGIVAVSLVLVAVSALAGPKGDTGKPSDTLSGLDCSTNQIARFNGTSWVCSYEVVGSGAGYKALDANGVVAVYPIIRFGDSYSQADGFIPVQIDGQEEWLLVSVYRSSLELNQYAGSLMFETEDCTGTPYGYDFGEVPEKNRHWGQTRRMVYTDYPAGTPRRLFYSEQYPAGTAVVIRSSYHPSDAGGSRCYCAGSFDGVSCVGQEQNMVPLIGTFTPELGFTPPFSLVLE